MRDANYKKPSENGYDPTTLYIDKKELAKLSQTMQ